MKNAPRGVTGRSIILRRGASRGRPLAKVVQPVWFDLMEARNSAEFRATIGTGEVLVEDFLFGEYPYWIPVGKGAKLYIVQAWGAGGGGGGGVGGDTGVQFGGSGGGGGECVMRSFLPNEVTQPSYLVQIGRGGQGGFGGADGEDGGDTIIHHLGVIARGGKKGIKGFSGATGDNDGGAGGGQGSAHPDFAGGRGGNGAATFVSSEGFITEVLQVGRSAIWGGGGGGGGCGRNSGSFGAGAGGPGGLSRTVTYRGRAGGWNVGSRQNTFSNGGALDGGGGQRGPGSGGGGGGGAGSVSLEDGSTIGSGRGGHGGLPGGGGGGGGHSFGPGGSGADGLVRIITLT